MSSNSQLHKVFELTIAEQKMLTERVQSQDAYNIIRFDA